MKTEQEIREAAELLDWYAQLPPHMFPTAVARQGRGHSMTTFGALEWVLGQDSTGSNPVSFVLGEIAKVKAEVTANGIPKPPKQSAIEMLLGELERTLSNPPKSIARDQANGLLVSTIFTSDGSYETGIVGKPKPDLSHTAAVERYPDEASARAGHARWLERVKDGQRSFSSLAYDGGREELTLEPMDEIDVMELELA